MHRLYSSLTIALLAIACLVGNTIYQSFAAPTEHSQEDSPAKKLTIVWTSGDPEVAHRMTLMYGHAAKSAGWFDEVRLIVWGPSARLTAADKDIQGKLTEMQKSGVVVEACVVCADSYGVADRLRELGIEVKPMGKPLSEAILDDGMHIVTF